jgi:hypothetical protein
MGQLAGIRADPVLKTILKFTQELIEKEKNEENIDFHSDDEDEKCIDLSTDSLKNISEEAETQENLMNHSWQKKRMGSIQISQLQLENLNCPIDDLDSSEAGSEKLSPHIPSSFQIQTQKQKNAKKSKSPKTISSKKSTSNCEELQTVEERTIESEDEQSYKKGEAPLAKIKYSHSINFESLTGCGIRDIFEERFLRVRQLQKNYIVHYLNKSDTDFRLSLEFLKQCDTVSVDLECSNKQTVSYMQFACRSKCYVFNLFKLGKNEDFLEFLFEIF